MIVRNARREAIDYGPTPGLSHLSLSGSICRPIREPKAPRDYVKEAAKKRAWNAIHKPTTRSRGLCRNGLHEVRAGNTVINPRGGVLCRECMVTSQRRRDQRRHARAAA